MKYIKFAMVLSFVILAICSNALFAQADEHPHQDALTSDIKK